MPSRARQLARRYLPGRIRRIGLEAIGREQSIARPAHVRRKKPKAAAKAKPSAKPATNRPRPVVEALRGGGTLADALVAETRALLADRQRDLANSMSAALRADPAAAELGGLTAGIIAAAGGFYALAWSHLRDLPDFLWTRHATQEWLRSGLEAEPEHAHQQISRLVAELPAFVTTSAWLQMIAPVFGYGDHDLVKRLYAVLDARVGDGSAVEASLVVQRDWLRPWVAATPDGRSAPATSAGSVPFAIMGYGHPGQSSASSNIGDHVQSLASLGHLARHQGVSYDGPQDLIDLMTQLRARVRPELQRHAIKGRVQLLQIDRDASMYAAIPPGTWTLAFGWYMHAIFENRYGFPFHPNLLPIFVSFHCSKRDLLTDEAVDYLKRFAPIGCRDWTTVDLLLSIGVPAFFSGCLTTTTRTVFPDHVDRPAEDAPVAYVDMPARSVPRKAPTHAHSRNAIRFRSFATNVGDAVDLLETYRTAYRGLVTTRLHCYLPVRSLGVPVDFQPNNRSDPRFAGLIDITDAEFDTIQARIDDLLEQVFGAMLSGQSPQQVYALWRELTAEGVAVAERRRAADHPLPAPASDLRGEVAQVRQAHPERQGDGVTVALIVPTGGAEAVPVLLGSVAAHATGAVRFILLTRSSDLPEASVLQAAAAGHTVELINTTSIGNDLLAGGRQPTPLDIDLLVLPDLLPDIDLVVVVPTDSMVTDDIADLAGLDLGGRLFAAPDPAGRSAVSGFGVLNQAANRLRNRTVAATELRRRAYARHRFDFDAFDVDVLVIDLVAWRARSMLTTYLPYIEEFGLTFRELLHLEAGPDRAVVPGRWHSVPGRSRLVDPALLHWSDGTKPWSSDIAPEQERWFAARAHLAG